MWVRRLLSGGIAVAYVVVFLQLANDPRRVIYLVAYLLLPLALIWFSEEMGTYTGIMRFQPVSKQSPGCLVAALGWLLLLAPVIAPIVSYLVNKYMI